MHVFRYILFSFFIGLIGLISFIEHDAWTYNMLEKHIQNTFENNLQAEFLGFVTHFSFFGSTLEFSDICVRPLFNQDWNWSAKKIRVSFSWFHFFTTGTLDMRMKIDEWNVESNKDDNQILVLQHLRQLFENPTLPVTVNVTSVSMNKASIRVFDRRNNASGFLCFNSRSYMSSEGLKNTIYILDGSLQIHDNYFLDGCSGSIQIEFDNEKKLIKRSKVAGNFTIPGLDNEYCYVVGSWHDNYGRFSLASSHDMCSIDPIIIGNTKGRIMSTFPVQLLKLLVPHIFKDTVIEGKCDVSLAFDRTGQKGLHGQIVMRDVVYNNQKLSDTIKMTVRMFKDLCSGVIDIRSIYGECIGKYTYDLKENEAEVLFSNTSSLVFPFTYWYIDPYQAEIALALKQNAVLIKGLCKTIHSISNQSHSYTIEGLHKQESLSLAGTFDDTIFSYKNEEIEGDDTYTKNKKYTFSWADKKQNPLFVCTVSYAPEKVGAVINGNLSISAIRLATSTWLGYPLQGTGEFNFSGTVKDKKIAIRTQLENGIIRLPKTYNCINELTTDLVIDIQNRECRLFSTDCNLHIGKIKLQQGRICFDTNWQTSFVHIPFLIDHCLINIEKNLFTSVSGALTIDKHSVGIPTCLKGTMLLDRAQVKRDISSKDILFNIRPSDVPGTTVPYDFLCDINLKTVNPINISTSQITTDLVVDLHLTNRLIKPDISGSISVCGGRLEFPYKPLYITHGNILFTPERSYDPTIELIAKNRIKHHDVSLHLAGSALTHHVMVHATPNLTDEQVIALLLFGSPHETLTALMPALIKQNLESLVFGERTTLEDFLFGRDKKSIHESGTSLIDSYVKKIFKPISLHFVPRFTDQTGRGGIRGALEIDINDRLHVLLQKNFSLSEDTRFEVEYFLSDDITLRSIRDERCDIGGEVEMRWKF